MLRRFSPPLIFTARFPQMHLNIVVIYSSLSCEWPLCESQSFNQITTHSLLVEPGGTTHVIPKSTVKHRLDAPPFTSHLLTCLPKAHGIFLCFGLPSVRFRVISQPKFYMHVSSILDKCPPPPIITFLDSLPPTSVHVSLHSSNAIIS
jgi:hypothetical protein